MRLERQPIRAQNQSCFPIHNYATIITYYFCQNDIIYPRNATIQLHTVLHMDQ